MIERAWWFKTSITCYGTFSFPSSFQNSAWLWLWSVAANCKLYISVDRRTGTPSSSPSSLLLGISWVVPLYPITKKVGSFTVCERTLGSNTILRLPITDMSRVCAGAGAGACARVLYWILCYLLLKLFELTHGGNQLCCKWRSTTRYVCIIYRAHVYAFMLNCSIRPITRYEDPALKNTLNDKDLVNACTHASSPTGTTFRPFSCRKLCTEGFVLNNTYRYNREYAWR